MHDCEGEAYRANPVKGERVGDRCRRDAMLGNSIHLDRMTYSASNALGRSSVDRSRQPVSFRL